MPPGSEPLMEYYPVFDKIYFFYLRMKFNLKDKWVNFKLNKMALTYKVDPEIKYPSYKSMDEFIDVELLKALDAPITQYIKSYIAKSLKKEDKFYLGPVTSNPLQNKTSGARYIRLTECPHQDTYFSDSYKFICDPKMWQFTDHAKQIPGLIEFINKLPFKGVGRITLIFDTGGHTVAPHRDHGYPKICHEFIWFRTNLRKKFYMLKSGEKKYVTSYSAWFDSVNQFHGAEAVDELNFSFRIDGIFNDEIRKLIPKPSNYNIASTPALWATKAENGR